MIQLSEVCAEELAGYPLRHVAKVHLFIELEHDEAVLLDGFRVIRGQLCFAEDSIRLIDPGVALGQLIALGWTVVDVIGEGLPVLVVSLQIFRNR